jgi:hypothetical protein
MTDVSLPQNAAPEDSPMGILAARRDQIAKETVLTLPVQRWSEPEITVSYRPVEPSEFRRAGLAADKALSNDKDEIASSEVAGILVECALSVDATNPNEHWEGFDHNLADALELTDRSARKTCRRLFVTTGGMVQHVNALVAWSAQAVKAVEDKFSGE